MSFTAGPGTTYLLTSTQPIPSGTANGVLYLNGSKVVTSGSALQFSGTDLTVNLDGSSLLLGTGGAATAAMSFRSTTRNQLRFPSGASFEWHEGVSERMRLTSTGLGIGTTSAAGRLDVDGSAYIGDDSNNALFIDSTSSLVTIGAAGRTSFSTSALRFLTSDGSAALERMRLDSSGNLGLGVTPQAWSTRALEIIGGVGISAVTGLDFTLNAYYNAGWLYRSTGAATRYEQVSGQHRWYNAASGTAGNPISFTQAMTLNASGNLLVGTTSAPASQRLRVAGGDVGFEGQYLYLVNAGANIQMGAAQSSQISNNDSTNTLSIARTGASSIITLSTAGTERARITSGGNFVVGTAALATTATDGFLYVPTCAGTPTGTPTTQTGTAPIVVDTTNNKLYFYSGGQWRDAGP